tara:strand:+ start:17191 stop:17745 length:555 start_codon:yes stop_codon:yes gene_type:complete
MVSGNMRVLARVGASAASINWNSSNMVGCTVFCIQYTYRSNASSGGSGINLLFNGDSDNADYHNMTHTFDYRLQYYNDGGSSLGSTTNLAWHANENPNVPQMNGYYTGATHDGASGEMWVKSNMRDSSYALWLHRGVNWDLYNYLGIQSQMGWYSTGGQITSILFTASGVGFLNFQGVLWGGTD